MKFSTAIQGLVGGQRIPVKDHWLILDELRKQTAISVGMTAILIIYIIRMVRLLPFCVCACSVVAVFVPYVELASHCRKCAAEASLFRWRRYFSFASAIAGLQWSLGTTAFHVRADRRTRMDLLATEHGLMIGGSGRSYLVAGAAIFNVGSVHRGLFLVFVVCCEWFVAGTSPIYLFLNVSAIRRIGAKTVECIPTKCDRQKLFDMRTQQNKQLWAVHTRLEGIAFTNSLSGLENTLDLARNFGARYDSGEFAILLPDTSLADVVDVSNRIRLAVSTIALSASIFEGVQIAISVVDASIKPGEPVQFE